MSSEDDIELSSEPELLMNTRERRSNAGNKMQALLQQEIDEMQNRTEHLDGDEIDLLFQEDEEDEDFAVDAPRSKGKGQDEDMVFSGDSDSDDDNNNEEEEEDEEAALQREEKLQRRKKQKKSRASAIVRKRVSPTEDAVTSKDTVQPARKKRHGSDQLNPESLLQAARRTSKRSSVVANKLKVYEKLSQAEEKRKIIQERLRKTRAKAQEELLTQEDRMRIALETEKFNLLSLNKYKELELSKKQSRLASQQRQKLKFKPQEVVMTMLSTTWQVGPLAELDDQRYWDAELKKREKKKRKYTRRTKKKIAEEEAAAKAESLGDSGEKTSQATEGEVLITPNADTTTITKEEDTVETTQPEKILEDASLPPKPEDSTVDIENKEKEVEVVKEEPRIEGVSSKPAVEEQDTPGSTIDHEEMTAPDTNNANSTEPGNAPEVQETNKTENRDTTDDRSTTPSTTTRKQVTFDNTPNVTIIDSELPTSKGVDTPSVTSASPASSNESTPQSENPIDNSMEEELQLVYEGPFQQTSKNFLTKFKIASDFSFTSDPRSTNFFGFLNQDKHNISPDAYKPLLHSKLSEDDILSENSRVSTENTNLVPNLDILTTFRRFGEFDRKYEKVLKVVEVKNDDIKITTPAPVGIYANNNTVKKPCLINNKSCKYFDPNLGVPYSDLDSYKIIQDIQNAGEDGEYKWYGFRNGGIYLKVKARHAKGVPEGF